MTNDTNWGIVAFIIVIILLGFAINYAKEQHEEAVAWKHLVDTRLSNLENTVSSQQAQVGTLTSIQQNSLTPLSESQIVSLIQRTISSLVPKYDYETIAGCYGVLPTNDTNFDIKCSKTVQK